jgi:hypothetical protein
VTTASGPSLVAPAITLVALLASILPLAASGATGPPLRALLTGAISAALLLVGSIPRGTTAARPYLDSIGLAGALGVITVEVGQSTTLVTQPGAPDIRLDGVLVAGLVLLLVAAIGQARDRGDYSAAWRAVASQVLGVLALVILLAFELAALDATSLGGIRAVGVILLLCAVHVVAFLLRRAPFTHSVAWIAIAGAAVAGIGALVTGAIDVVEVASVPVRSSSPARSRSRGCRRPEPGRGSHRGSPPCSSPRSSRPPASRPSSGSWASGWWPWRSSS